MHDIVEILGAFGDSRPHYKEEAYEVIRYAEEKKHWSLKYIDKKMKRYLEYGLLCGIPDMKLKGFYQWQITPKGVLALDYYRNARGYKDPAKGKLF